MTEVAVVTTETLIHVQIIRTELQSDQHHQNTNNTQYLYRPNVVPATEATALMPNKHSSAHHKRTTKENLEKTSGVRSVNCRLQLWLEE